MNAWASDCFQNTSPLDACISGDTCPLIYMLIISLNRSLVRSFVVLLFHMPVSLTHSLVCRSFFFLALRFLHRSVVISKLTPGQVAAKTGKLKIGQIVVKVCVVLRVHSSLDLVVSKEVCVVLRLVVSIDHPASERGDTCAHNTRSHVTCSHSHSAHLHTFSYTIHWYHR
jgi:hypothetical protein